MKTQENRGFAVLLLQLAFMEYSYGKGLGKTELTCCQQHKNNKRIL